MFTPAHTLIGGFLLHVASSSLLSGLGRVFGGSGIIDAALFGDRAAWRWALLGGMIGAPLVNKLVGLDAVWAVHGVVTREPVQEVVRSAAQMVAAGLLVGVGSKLGSGCTSGHFLCGFSRLSPRSVVATCTFFTTAVITAHCSGGPVDLTSHVVPSYTPLYPGKSEWTALLALPVALYALSSWLSERTREDKSTTLPLAALTGYTFSTGLQLSGMASPLKVLRFLHLPGLFDAREWDPSLLLVVLGGIIPNAIHYAVRVKPEVQRGEGRYFLPTGGRVDGRLVLGAALFGVGWGLTGLCLLPSVVGLGSRLAGADGAGLMPFAAAMVAGMWGVRAVGA